MIFNLKVYQFKINEKELITPTNSYSFEAKDEDGTTKEFNGLSCVFLSPYGTYTNDLLTCFTFLCCPKKFISITLDPNNDFHEIANDYQFLQNYLRLQFVQDAALHLF